MKKYWFLLLSFCLCSLGFALPIKEHKIEEAALSELAVALNIPSDANILFETQKRWLRKAGQERWEVQELSPQQKTFVFAWAKKQGFFNSWDPVLKRYDKALILGATTSRMQMRLDHLKKLWLEGVRFNEIVWLTGDRPLDHRVDDLIERCSTESEAAQILWEEADLPEEMGNLPVVFIAVPMKEEGGSLKRPNTEDTLVAWLKTDPQPCTALFVSNQPFCSYQFAVLKTSLPKAIQFDVIGEGVDPIHQSAAVILDSIARWIYLESLSK